MAESAQLWAQILAGNISTPPIPKKFAQLLRSCAVAEVLPEGLNYELLHRQVLIGHEQRQRRTAAHRSHRRHRRRIHATCMLSLRDFLDWRERELANEGISLP